MRLHRLHLWAAMGMDNEIMLGLLGVPGNSQHPGVEHHDVCARQGAVVWMQDTYGHLTVAGKYFFLMVSYSQLICFCI